MLTFCDFTRLNQRIPAVVVWLHYTPRIQIKHTFMGFLSLRNRRQLSPLSTQNVYPNYLMILYAKIAHQVIFESYVLKNSLLRTFLYVVQISFYHTRLQ